MLELTDYYETTFVNQQ